MKRARPDRQRAQRRSEERGAVQAKEQIGGRFGGWVIIFTNFVF